MSNTKILTYTFGIIILFFVYASFALKIKPKQIHVKERKQKPVQLKLPIE